MNTPLVPLSQLGSVVKHALDVATRNLHGQYRKDGITPAITHPIAVAEGVRRYTDNPEIIAAALLHDTLEDCPTVTTTLLREEFGNRIAELVCAVTAPIVEGASWEAKKLAYITHITLAPVDALLIVAIDKMVNFHAYFSALKSGDPRVSTHFRGTPLAYFWYYGAVGDILQQKLANHPIAADYHAALDAQKTLTAVMR